MYGRRNRAELVPLIAPFAMNRFCSLLIVVGNSLTFMGCMGLLLVWSGAVDMQFFAIGISSGIRVIGSVAIAGCLLSAIGYGLVERLQ
jgi:hypothetical protein